MSVELFLFLVWLPLALVWAGLLTLNAVLRWRSGEDPAEVAFPRVLLFLLGGLYLVPAVYETPHLVAGAPYTVRVRGVYLYKGDVHLVTDEGVLTPLRVARGGLYAPGVFVRVIPWRTGEPLWVEYAPFGPALDGPSEQQDAESLLRLETAP